MRGSVAKKLRRIAKQRTVGLPDRALRRSPSGSAVNVVQATRGLYRMFKNQWRKGLIKLT